MTASKTVTLDGTPTELQPFSGRRAIRAISLLKKLAKAAPEIMAVRAEFVRKYEKENYTELTRAEAQMRFGPIPLTRRVPDGDTFKIEPILEDGRPVMGPSRLAHLTDADWEKSGNVLKLADPPSRDAQVAAIFPAALDLAESEILQLLALITIRNKDYGKAAREGTQQAVLEEKADELQDELANELLELAVVGAELIEEQFADKVEELRRGNRLGNLMALFGKTEPDEALTTTAPAAEVTSTTKQTSSTDSESSTAGESDAPSTAPPGDSS